MKVGDLVRITDQEAHLYGKLGVIVDVRRARGAIGFLRDAYDILVDGDIKRAYWKDEFEVIDGD